MWKLTPCRRLLLLDGLKVLEGDCDRWTRVEVLEAYIRGDWRLEENFGWSVPCAQLLLEHELVLLDRNGNSMRIDQTRMNH